MKTGDSIKVKSGVCCPDNDSFDISGWEGRILNIDGEYIDIEWDSITLSQMPNEFIQDSIDEGMEFSEMCLGINEVNTSTPRDKKEDVAKMQNKIEKIFSTDEIDNRISEILKTDDLEINELNLDKYYKYLKSNISKPCILTGMEVFHWEEPYLFGGKDKKEYEALKKVKPSHNDHFEFLDLETEIDESIGIMVKVMRKSDRKKFTLLLWDLVVIDKITKNYQLISDYSYWMTNYR